MPIYEYVCQDCQHEFDALRSMSQADAALPCTECGSEHIKRKISNFFAESGGRAVAGMSEPGCSFCSGGSCAHCGHS
jgi:putative FmdB family regulatory protein